MCLNINAFCETEASAVLELQVAFYSVLDTTADQESLG